MLVFMTTLACGVPAQVKPTLTLVPTIVIQGSPPVPAEAATPTPASSGDLATAVAGVATVAPASPTPEITATAGRAMPLGVVNIMLLGSDVRATAGSHTDVIMLVSVNIMKQTVSVISFPRDLYVPIPGWTTQRLNTAKPHGGFETLADTMEENFAVRPTYYMQTDFAGFQSIIDSLGGINVYAGSTLVDRCDLPIAENGKCTVQPGLYKMDGATALWYVRSRHTSSDLDRLRREQEVLSAIFVQIMSAGANRDLPGLYARFQSSVDTNLTIQAIAPLLPTAARVFNDRNQIRHYALTVKEAKPFVTDTGAQVLMPDYERISQILDEAIFNP